MLETAITTKIPCIWEVTNTGRDMFANTIPLDSQYHPESSEWIIMSNVLVPSLGGDGQSNRLKVREIWRLIRMPWPHCDACGQGAEWSRVLWFSLQHHGALQVGLLFRGKFIAQILVIVKIYLLVTGRCCIRNKLPQSGLCHSRRIYS